MADNLRKSNEKRLGIDSLPESLFLEDLERKEDLEVSAEALSRTPEAVEEVAQQAQESGLISKNTAKEIKEDARTQRIPETIARSEIKEDTGQPKSPKENFMSTLALFLPSVIGGIAGAAFEGASGAEAGISGGLKGASAGVKLVGDVEKIETEQLRQEKLRKETQGSLAKMDFTKFVTKDGTPVARMPGTRQFISTSGDPIDPKDVKLTQLFKQERSLAEAQRAEQGVASRFSQRFGLKKKETEQLSNTQIEDLGALNDTKAAIDRIGLLLTKADIGPVSSRVQSLKQVVGTADPNFTQLKSESTSALNNYIKAMTGAQMSEPEAKRLAIVVPSINDNKKTFKDKLKAFRRIVLSREKEIARAISSGQPLKKETIQKMIEQAEKQFGAAEPIEPARGPASINVDQDAIAAEIARRKGLK